MYKEDDEEYKKRLERAKLLRSTIGITTSDDYSNSTPIQYDNDYLGKLNQARELRNSVGMITSNDLIEDSIINQNSMSDYDYLQNKYDMEYIRENVGNKIIDSASEIIKNPLALMRTPDELEVIRQEQNKQKQENMSEDKKQEFQNKINEFNNSNNQNVRNDIKSNTDINTQIKNNGIRLATQEETENAKKMSNSEIDASIEGAELNRQIKEGGADAVNAYFKTLLRNAYSGLVKKPIAGLVNVGTTIAGLGIRGTESWAKLLGFNEAGDSLNNAYNDVVDFGKYMYDEANYETNVLNQVDDGFTKGSAQVVDVISNVVGNQIIGYATGVPGVTVQGLSVGGSSAQEVLNENKDNIGQATLTGLAKGYTSYLTEKMFDANILTRGTKPSSISDKITNGVLNRISNQYGKKFAYNSIGIVGENLEELVEDNVDNLIDKLVNDKDLPSWEQWKKETGETAKITTISTIIMNLLGLGGESFENKQKDIEANKWLNEAEKIIEQENMAIHYDPRQVQSKNNMEEFYISEFNQNGDLENVTPTLGKEIKNIQPELMISPVVVKDSNTGLYKVIDGATGVVLDNDYYSSITEAENSYNEKVRNLSESRISDINNTINQATYVINNNVMSMITQLEDNLPDIAMQYAENNKSNTSDLAENKNTDNLKSKGTSYTPTKVKSITNEFTTQTEYTKNEMADIWNNKIDNNNKNVIYDKDGKIKSYIAIEEDGDNLKISLYDNNDNIVQSETIQPQNGMFTSESINNAIEKVTGVYKQNNANKTPGKSTFYENKPNYATSNINEIEKEINKKKSYTLEQIGETWSDIQENTYDMTLNDDMYIELEENDGKLEAVLYDGSTEEIPEVNRVEIEPNSEGKYTAKAINRAIEEAATIPNENQPIKGQVDIEGNIVKQKDVKKAQENNKTIKVQKRKFTQELRNKGYIDLNNKTVATREDMADIAQIFRNPNYETFRVIYLNGNTIVGQEALTTKRANNIVIINSKNDEAKYFYKMKDRMDRLNADGYYIMHNHPSGVAEASKQDIGTTIKFYKNVDGFKGHIIINSGTYAAIYENDGKMIEERNKIPNYKLDDIDKSISKEAWTNIKINDRNQIINLMNEIKNSPDYSTLILTDAKLFPRAIIDIPNSFMNADSTQIDGYIKNLSPKYGAVKAFFATKDNVVFDNLKNLTTLQDGVLYSDKKLQGLFIEKGLESEEQISIVENNKRTFEKEIDNYKKQRKNNIVNNGILEINNNIIEGISKKKQSSFLNEYLKNEVKRHDYYVDGEKIIANKHTIGKLKNGRTLFDKRIDTSIRDELKTNIIGNLDSIISTSKIYQANLKDTKNHEFADTFDRRISNFKYKNQNYKVMFEIGKKGGINTLYGIENIKKISNSLSKDTNVSKKPIKGYDPTVLINNNITQKNNSVKSNIQDFGEKIGGARKDLSGGRTTNTPGKEVIHDYTVKKTDNGYTVNFKNKVLKDGFKTQSEAEKYILDFKNSIKDNRAFVEEGTNRDGDPRYSIYLRNPRTLKSQHTGKVFSNKQDAENYAMALSMYLKENGKNLFRPQIQKVDRVNANNKNATKATGDDILNNFGFKGGEFGNWVTQNERQQFLNYAQDAFTDLAAALDVTPDSLGQQKAMSIAFGARGKGLTGAVAHFEPAKKVINMTRLKGAGSLAHEYGHSIDNYLSRVGGYDENGMVTSNLRNPKLSDNMKEAIKQVEDAMKYNISTNQEEVDKKNAIYEKARKENLEYNLRYIDKVFKGEAKNWRRIKGKYEEVPIKVTEKQKSDYQKIRETLMKGGLKGDIDYKANGQTLKTEKIYPEPISTLQKMYKEVVGRKIDDDTVYSLYRQGKPTRQVTEVKSESGYSKSALELDRETGRATAYFSRTDEMWARAFESYISDKLKAKGIKDTYLVHSVNNNEYALFNPFPAGEERKNINKAFDNLIQTMKDEGLFTSSGTPQNIDEDTGIRYMKKNNSKAIDNQGRTLTKQQQEYFKNSKLRNNKNELEVVYHTTPNIFTEFDDSKLGDNTLYDNTAFGHFVTTNEEFSKRFGDIDNKGIESHTMEMYANVENPITHPYNAHYKYSENELDNIVIKYFEAINEKEGLEQLKEFAEEEETSLYDTYMNMTIDNDLFDNAAEERKILKEKGYDAVEFVEGLESNLIENSNSNKPVSSYAIFNSKQLKNINNTTPTANNDIRFAKRSAKEINDNLRNAERGESYIEQEIQKIEQTGNWDNSIPVTKLTDIRKTIEDYLGLGIKKGHFRQDAYAIYKGNNDVIRTKEYKDMDSILHETGHAMDLGKRLNIDKESIADELLTAINKLGGYEEETRTVRLEEGFAEVIREYSIVPEQAKQEYPQTVAVLEGLRKTDKKFNDFISKVQQQSYNYIHQNPRNRTLSNISIGEQTDKKSITKNFIKQEVMRNIYDKDWIVKSAVNELAKANGKTANQIKASENAYYLTRLASGKTDKVISMLSDGYIDEHGKKLMPGLKGIGNILGNDAQRWNDLRAYLVAQRDLEYKAKTLKTGIRTMDSKAVVEQFKNDKQIQQASKLVYDTLNGVMQYAVNNGLITQEGADKLKQSNAFYVPMHRVLDNRGNQIGRRGAVADLIQKRTGSELDVKDVLENIIANSSNMIQQVENNNILRALYKEGQTTGLTGAIYDVIDTPLTKIGTAQLSTWENELKKQGVNTADLDLEKTIDLFAPNNKVDSKNLITSFINENGKRIYLQFNDDLLFNSLMNMDRKFMSQVLKINSKMNMPLRYGATMANLGFAIPNMISDTAQAAVYSTAGFIPVVDNALGVLDILASTNKTVRNFVNRVAPTYATRINMLFSLYQQSGATNSTRLSQYRESTQNLMSDVYGTKSKNLGIKEKYKPLKRLLDILTYIPEISEQSTRFRVFEKNYEYYKNKGTAEMDSRILAALESRDATQDFGRTGNITREINQLIPFSAARVGSAYTFAEKIKANPKQVGIRIAILTAIAMSIKAIGYDDKEIEELNQRKKDDNFVMKVGDDIVTIKKPQGFLRSIVNLAEYIQDLTTDHIEEGKEGERLGQWLNNAIMDNMPADEVTGLVPNAVAPLIENAINKDFYYNTDIVKSYDQDLPDAEQYYDYNSQLAIWLGKIFNYSPAKIDNLISGYFGGLGTSITNTIDYALGKMGVTPEKPEMGAEQNAIGKRFIVNVNSNSSSIDEIYSRKTELTKLQNGGTISSKEEKELETIKAAISNMSDLNKQIKEIKKDLTMSGSEKADKIRVLQQEKTDTARQALGKDLIHLENKGRIQSTQFYPNDTIKKNGYSLTLNSTQKKEYEKIASDFYLKYERQGLYNKEKLEDIKSKAKEYAKNQMFQKYRANLVKTK